MSNTNPKYDWETIRNDYILGYTEYDPNTFQKIHKYYTLEAVAQKYGVNFRYLKEKSRKEGWVKRREAVKAKLKESFNEDRIHSFVSDSAQFDAMTLMNLHKLYKLLDFYWAKYNEILDESFNPENYEEEDLPILKIQELKTIVDLMDKTQALVRRTVGEPIHLNRGESNLLMQKVFNPYADDTDGKSTQDLDLERKIEKLNEKREDIKKTTSEMRSDLEKLYAELENNT